MGNKAHDKNALGWLEILFIYFQRQLPAHGHFFRTAVDNWGMYVRGREFLTRNGRPIFYNKPRSDDKRLLRLDFVSRHALAVIESPNVQPGKLIVDHVVPISRLHQLIRDTNPQTLVDLEQILRRYYMLGVVTREEDTLLNAQGLRSSMPNGWSSISGDVFARYITAGIEQRSSASK